MFCTIDNVMSDSKEGLIKTTTENLIAIENLIVEQNAKLNEIENQISISRINGNTSLALMLDERADSILKGIFNLRMSLQRLQ